MWSKPLSHQWNVDAAVFLAKAMITESQGIYNRSHTPLIIAALAFYYEDWKTEFGGQRRRVWSLNALVSRNVQPLSHPFLTLT